MLPGEALNLIARATDELAEQNELRSLVRAANDSLNLKQKQELMTMVLEIIAADDEKHAGEMRLLAVLIDSLDIPEKTMSEAYADYFDGRSRQD